MKINLEEGKKRKRVMLDLTWGNVHCIRQQYKINKIK